MRLSRRPSATEVNGTKTTHLCWDDQATQRKRCELADDRRLAGHSARGSIGSTSECSTVSVVHSDRCPNPPSQPPWLEPSATCGGACTPLEDRCEFRYARSAAAICRGSFGAGSVRDNADGAWPQFFLLDELGVKGIINDPDRCFCASVTCSQLGASESD